MGRTFTTKQLLAIKAGKYGQLTNMIHQLADSALKDGAALNDAQDDTRRVAERLLEFTTVRPEHERVLILLTRPLGEKGLPALEVYCDRRVKLKVAFEDDRLPMNWNNFKEEITYPEIICVPTWINEHIA